LKVSAHLVRSVTYRALFTAVTPLMLLVVQGMTFVPYQMMSPLLSNRMHELAPGVTQQ